MVKCKIIVFCFFLPFFLVACEKEDVSGGVPDSSYFACIWNKAPFSAFTDLVEYEGRDYCCFREAPSHVPNSSTEYGKIRILSSTNGVDWVSVACIESSEFDFRDPKLIKMPNNKLMLYSGCSSLVDGKYGFKKTMVSFASDFMPNGQLIFDNSNSISIEKNPSLSTYFLWKVVKKKNKVYAIAYNGVAKGAQIAVLVESEDGINYSVVSYLNFAANSNEAGIEFLSTGEIVVVIRTNGGNGYIATAPYPYKEWDSEVLTQWIHCPNIININDNLFVAGRAKNGTSIFHINGKTLEELYTFPASGDYGYPGLLHVKNDLWISYYASNSIFFAKIPMFDVLKKAGINK